MINRIIELKNLTKPTEDGINAVLEAIKTIYKAGLSPDDTRAALELLQETTRQILTEGEDLDEIKN